MIRKHVPILSLVTCTLLLWGVWYAVPQQPPSQPRAAVPLAMAAPTVRFPARPIRVGLTPEPVRSLAIEVTGPYELRPVGSDQVLATGAKLGRTTVQATPGGLKIGAHDLPVTRVEIRPARSPAVWVNDHQYRGTVRLFRRPGGLVSAVNALPLEDYVACVVDSEMPADFPDEARKAQAIIARTYALYQMQQAAPGALADLSASTRSQKYLGNQYRDGQRLLAGETDAGRRAARSTRHEVCTFEGQVFCTYYCAACGGGTVRGSEVFADAAAPLRPVPCDWCRDARLYRWTLQLSKFEAGDDLAALLQKGGQERGTIRTIALARAPAGEIPEFDVRTDRRSVRVSGAELRQALGARGMYSPRFTVEDRGDTLVISGRGHGHGVGLCQWGARGLALEGRTCEQILAHYYPGMRLEKCD